MLRVRAILESPLQASTFKMLAFFPSASTKKRDARHENEAGICNYIRAQLRDE